MPTSKACLLLILLLSPAMAYAAGLGRLTVNSALGQPFNAEIDLVAIKKEEKSSLMARLASQDAFRQANVDYVPLLSTFKTSIENRSDGQAYVKIVSLQPIAEPFLNILVELNWSSGRLLREYTVLLGPPEIGVHLPATLITQPGQSAVPHSANSSAANSSEAASALAEKPGLAIKSPVIGEEAPVPASATISKAQTVYGPVKRGDTLAGIVRNISPPSGVSVNQMLVALHRANRDAFFGDNMHRLKAGPILRVPDDSEIGAITPAEADKEVKVQTVEWNRYKLIDVGDLIPVREELKQMVTGKIDRNVEAGPAAAQEPVTEILKLSQGEAPWSAAKDAAGNKNAGKDIGGKNEGAKDSGMEAISMQDRLRAMEEDDIAKSLSRSEANTRVALLEKNIKELQRLLELKNPALASMQKRVEVLEPDGASVTPPDPLAATVHQGGLTSEFILTSQAAPYRAELDNVEEAGTTPPATVRSATEIAKPMHVAKKSAPKVDSTPGPPVKNSLIDDLTANIEYLGGALVLLITGIVGVSMVGRSKEASPDNSNADRVSSEPIPSTLASSASSAIHSAEPGLADVNFDLDDTKSTKPKEFAERTTHWREIVTRLDLARAYQQMGDKDAARQVLQEAIREGDVQQQQSARLLLANL